MSKAPRNADGRRAEHAAVTRQAAAVAAVLDANADLFVNDPQPYLAAARRAGLVPSVNPRAWAAVERLLDKRYGCA